MIAAGLELDLESITRGYVVRMRSATEGVRNSRLHRYAIELVRCEIDPEVLIGPARATGLPMGEIFKTISGAVANFSDQYGPSTLEIATDWRARYGHRLTSRFRPLLDEIVRLAVAQNTTSPMINQSGIQIGVDRTTVQRWLDALCQRNALTKKPMGRRANGLLRSNCYELRVDRPRAASH